MPEPGFEAFLKELQKKDITHFIEGQPDIGRPEGFEVIKAKRIVELNTFPYDASKVKEFSLSTADGKTIKVVSKRLSPIKSINAENEFRISNALFNRGIRTPQPIGVVRDKGNTYFLWRKLDSVKSVRLEWKDEIKKQQEEITRQLEQLGIKNYDIHERNFVTTIEQGKPVVWLVDLERIVIPAKLTRRFK